MEDLATPFTKEEIDSIVHNLPLEKSLRWDIFNSEFMNKCWTVVAQDF
jgi:hypothetical protein